MRPSCPKPERLFEYISIPAEMTLSRRTRIRWHLFHCSDCRETAAGLRQRWSTYFSPEPEVTSSLMKVYSRLQGDETLVLKGWKLDEMPRAARGWHGLSESAFLRGGVSVALGALLMFFVGTLGHHSTGSTVASSPLRDAKLPLAQIRSEDKNRIRVQYVQPELLQSIEFTTDTQ